MDRLRLPTLSRRTFIEVMAGGLLAAPFAAKAQQPAPQRVAEAFAMIDRNFVAAPDWGRLMVGALQGLEHALPSGVLHITDNAEGSTVVWQPSDRPVQTATFPVPTSMDSALPTVGAVYEIATRLAPDIPADALTSAMLREAVSRLDPYSAFIDRATAIPNPTGAVRSQMLDGGIGYIELRDKLVDQSGPDVSAALAAAERSGMTAVVLDLRNHAGGALTAAVEVTELFLKARQLICYVDGRTRARFSAQPRKAYPGIPMAVLVNNRTAASAEIVATALQDWKRALVVGTPTLGQASLQELIRLSDGSRLWLTTVEWFSPKGRSVRSSGVLPDLLVEPTDTVDSPQDQPSADALLARDNVLHRAVRYLKALPSGQAGH